MSNQAIEIIDSTNLKIIGEVPTLNEEIDGNYKYHLGLLDKNVLIRIHNLQTDNQLVTFLFERANYAELIARIEDVFAGKLREMKDEGYFIIKKGKDYLVISVTEVFLHTAFAPIVHFNLTNNRSSIVDGRERDSRNMYMSIETGRKMLEEMKRIAPQVL